MIWAPYIFACLFVFGVLVLTGGSMAYVVCFVVLAILVAVGWIYRDRLRAWATVKLTEWNNDLKQLGLWVRLAFSRRRSTLETATMTHQMSFLQGRLMSPMNLFGVAAAAVLLVPLTFAAQEWRINRIKNEARMGCTDIELSRTQDGRYRTQRQACADLGAQREAAAEWRTRAIEAEARAIRDVARVREEQELALAAEQERRRRSAALSERTRRRQNETIVAAIGGPAPDLDRSLCELAGAGECPPSPGSVEPAPAPAAGTVPSGAGADTTVAAPDVAG